LVKNRSSGPNSRASGVAGGNKFAIAEANFTIPTAQWPAFLDEQQKRIATSKAARHQPAAEQKPVKQDAP
jgi:hypothetical protein